ncbi:membrane protein [Mycobacterium phage Ph8s]|nr:membrane protein [Mycobacterium phage Ph8s]
MKKTIAAVIIGLAAILSLSACEGGTGTSDYQPSTIFMPMPGNPGVMFPVMI